MNDTPHWNFLDFDLPGELIAQYPVEPRDSCRLLHIHRSSHTLTHHHFYDLPQLLQPNDLLVLNDSKVIPARLLGTRRSTRGKWEGLYLQSLPDNTWEILAKSGGKPKEGEWIDLYSGLALQLIEKKESQWIVRPEQSGSAIPLLEQYGNMPLPPYIRKGLAEERDKSDYQTVYAQPTGSVAAPTAGLHFTPEVFAGLRQRQIDWTTITLHVGLGTFEPIRTADPRQHIMHGEWATVSEAAVEKINATKQRDGRIIAVGTTATRTLETAAKSGHIEPFSGWTAHYIYPPYDWKITDGLITNFHLPQTTLLLLVAALAGEATLQRAYQAAIEQRYRFFSYGDAMLIY